MASTETLGCGGGSSGGGGAGTGSSTGSGSGSGIPGLPPDYPVAAALGVLWKDLKTKLDRHKALFARKRADKAAADHPDWQAEAGQPKIVARVQQETSVVEAYLAKRLGTPSAPGPLMNGVNDKTPKQLDLDVVANYKKGLSASDRKATADGFRVLRRERAETIVWRATAFHPEVWQTATMALNEVMLDEMLDRRLRAIERMELNVNSGDLATLSPPDRSFTVSSAAGPWKDGYLQRFVEYGFLPEKPFLAVEATMTGWTRGSNNTLIFNPLPEPGVAMPPNIRPYWPLVYPDGWDHKTPLTSIWIHYKKGSRKPADVIGEMFTPNEDFTKRCWLYCDATLSAVQIEALWFGKHRREGNDNTFNTLVERTDYTYLGPLVNRSPTTHSSRILMDDEPSDTFFDNKAIDLADVEVGDELIVWNNPIYTPTGGGAWTNEFSIVMDVDSDPLAGAVADRLMLAGHGIKTRTAPEVAADLAIILKSNLSYARTAITTKLQTTPTATSVLFASANLVAWDPYGEFAALPKDKQPWWVELDPTWWRDEWKFATLQDAVASIPRMIIADSTSPAGYAAPPRAGDALYFPLFAPMYPDNGFDGDTWKSYLVSRANGDRGYVILIELPIDGRVASGLFFRRGQLLPIVRPQVS